MYNYESKLIAAVSMVPELWAGRQGSDSQQRQRLFLYATAVANPTLGSTQLRIRWVPSVISRGGKAVGA